MTLNDTRLLNLEALQHPGKHDVELSVCELIADAHPGPHAEREHWRLGLLEPTLRTEDFWIVP